jgi:hypothetical protein
MRCLFHTAATVREGPTAVGKFELQAAALAAALASFSMPVSLFGARLTVLHASVVAVVNEDLNIHTAPVLQAPAYSTASTPAVQQLWTAAAQQQQQGSEQDFAESVAYWLHAQRLMQVSPAAWQQHVAQHLLSQHAGSSSSSTGGGPTSSAASSAAAAAGAAGSKGLAGPSYTALLADLLCDWCTQPMAGKDSSTPAAAAAAAAGQSSGEAGGDAGSSSSKAQLLGCPSCGAVQYCSRACADAAKKVHAANCW